jgi:hypothetical protein
MLVLVSINKRVESVKVALTSGIEFEENIFELNPSFTPQIDTFILLKLAINYAVKKIVYFFS